MPFAPVVRQVTIQTKAHKVVNRAVNVFEDSFGIFQHPLRDLGATCSGHCAQEGHQKTKTKKGKRKKGAHVFNFLCVAGKSRSDNK